MKKVNLQKARVRGAIAFHAEIGEPVIYRKTHIHNYFHTVWTSLGKCPFKMARGGKTSFYMEEMASEFGYEFKSDGRNKGGNHINPRLVKIGHIES